MLSVLLGYFGSNLKREHVNAFLAFIAVDVTADGCSESFSYAL